MVNDPKAQIYLGKNKQDMQITSTHKPKTYKTKNYLEIKQKRREYYQKNKHKIKQNNKRQQERDELEQKFYKYGFWLLLTAVSVNLILTQI